MSTPPYPLHPEPLKKGWLESHARWKIPLGCLTLLFLIALSVAGFLLVVTGSMRHSEVYKQAMARAQENQLVREQIGEPIEAGRLFSGRLVNNGSSGDADLEIPIHGPRGKGVVHAVAEKSDGVWNFTRLEVRIEGHAELIDLLPARVHGESPRSPN